MPIRNTFRCSVSWEEMTPVTSGFRHCAHCDRVVADLRWASADEAARWLELQGGKGCAQMHTGPDGTAVFRKGVLLAAGALSIGAVGVSLPLTLLTVEPVRPHSVQAAQRPSKEGTDPHTLDPELVEQLQALGGYLSL